MATTNNFKAKGGKAGMKISYDTQTMLLCAILYALSMGVFTIAIYLIIK